MVIATGNSARQVAAMADRLTHRLRDAGCRVGSEGLPQSDWVLLDAGDIIVHLFRPEVRAFYNLEKMWGEGRKVVTANTGAVPPGLVTAEAPGLTF
jgi:ribosome-associated protein